jgi:hypothetical protein
MSSRQTEDDRDQAKSQAAVRAARLAEALRANLQKRKAQTRARRGGAEDTRRDGTPAADGTDDT